MRRTHLTVVCVTCGNIVGLIVVSFYIVLIYDLTSLTVDYANYD